MPVVKELLKVEENGHLSFGDYTLEQKQKVEDFEYDGDSYKVKTYKEITKLERNSIFVYESVPGSTVRDFVQTIENTHFYIEGIAPTQVTLGMEESSEYEVYVDGVSIGGMKTNVSGKLVCSVELGGTNSIYIEVIKR